MRGMVAQSIRAYTVNATAATTMTSHNLTILEA
ncbi:hypothetical protein JOD51_001069 [Curtobacterium herbarum]|nr:hypothetical protein [Curtobacterium herbarum]